MRGCYNATRMPKRPVILIERARKMRRAPSPGEKALWGELRGRGNGKLVFRKQHLVCGYIVDFACVLAKVVIEVDSVWFHMDKGDYDAKRQQDLEKAGYLVLRYWHSDVMERTTEIGSDIVELCRKRIAERRANS